MFFDVADESMGIATPITLFLLPMLVGLALLAEMWIPLMRTRQRKR